MRISDGRLEFICELDSRLRKSAPSCASCRLALEQVRPRLRQRRRRLAGRRQFAPQLPVL